MPERKHFFWGEVFPYAVYCFSLCQTTQIAFLLPQIRFRSDRIKVGCLLMNALVSFQLALLCQSGNLHQLVCHPPPCSSYPDTDLVTNTNTNSITNTDNRHSQGICISSFVILLLPCPSSFGDNSGQTNTNTDATENTNTDANDNTKLETLIW